MAGILCFRRLRLAELNRNEGEVGGAGAHKRMALQAGKLLLDGNSIHVGAHHADHVANDKVLAESDMAIGGRHGFIFGNADVAAWIAANQIAALAHFIDLPIRPPTISHQ